MWLISSHFHRKQVNATQKMTTDLKSKKPKLTTLDLDYDWLITTLRKLAIGVGSIIWTSILYRPINACICAKNSPDKNNAMQYCQLRHIYQPLMRQTTRTTSLSARDWRKSTPRHDKSVDGTRGRETDDTDRKRQKHGHWQRDRQTNGRRVRYHWASANCAAQYAEVDCRWASLENSSQLL